MKTFFYVTLIAIIILLAITNQIAQSPFYTIAILLVGGSVLVYLQKRAGIPA